MLLHTITTYLRTIPPLVIVVAIALSYIFVAGGRWTWPMLLDAALLAIYYAKPATWPTMLLIGIVRHVPFLAREVAVLCRLHEYHGATLHVALFVLPALRQYTTGGHSPVAEPPARDIPPAVQISPPPPVAQPSTPLRPAQWLGEVNDNATKPMLGIVGATQLGKSTMALAAMGRRAGHVVVATPKPKEEDAWNGATAHRLSIDLATRRVDWTPIIRAIDGVHYEMLRRKAQGDTRADQLTLVIDEYSTILRNAPKQTRDQVIELWSMGASSRIRVIVIAPEVNAKAWGIEGQRDLLDNLVFLRVEDGRRWSIGRLDPNGRLIDPQPCDTTPLRQLATEAQLVGREWQPATPPPPMPDPAVALLSGLLGAGVRSEGVRVPVGGEGASGPLEAIQTPANANANDEASKRIAMYVEWRRAGIKKEQGRAIRRAAGDGLDDAEWAEALKRLTNEGQTTV